MPYSPEALKSFANRLARTAVTEDGRNLTRMLRSSGMLEPAFRRDTDTAAEQRAAANRVGIWERNSDKGTNVFVRCVDKMNDWNLWANLPRIEPKRGKKRVALIGESVARGYLYDPQFTPAMALERTLQLRMGKDAVEVIDLARTNLKWEIQELAKQAVLLQPDLAVIFAGNNWNVHFTNPADLPYLDATWREQGAAGLKRSMEQRLADDVRGLVNEIASYYQEKNIPLVWMIPEFNLGDWRDAQTNAPYLPNGANGEWITLLEAAQNAFKDDDIAAACDLAGQTTALDQGVNAAAPYILADCNRRRGDWDAARFWLEKARDAAIWDFSKVISPRVYSVTQNAVRAEAPKHLNNAVVDLPEIFKQHLAGELPDRRLFLDFCHLTVRGIEVAMEAAACCVLRSFKVRSQSRGPSPGQNAIPNRQVRAEGAFLAAVHNAHHHQCREIISHHCRQSIELWPKIAQVMTGFIDIQTRRTPMLMCKSAEEMAALGSPLIPNYLLRKNTQQLDAVLLDAIVDALKKVGLDFEKTLIKLRCEEHGVRHGQRDLLDYYYCSATGQAQEIMWVMPRQLEEGQRKANHYYKAYWRESKFAFVGEANLPVLITLTCRVPDSTGTEPGASVHVNGTCVADLAATDKWGTWDITVPADVAREGLNEISVYWPVPRQFSDKPFRTQTHDIAEGMPDPFHVFGEIHSLTAARIQEASEANDSSNSSAISYASGSSQ